VLVYLEPPPALAPAWAAHPLILDIGPDSGFYLVPPVGGTGLKIGDHNTNGHRSESMYCLGNPTFSAIERSVETYSGLGLEGGGFGRL
jgi:hypothetical protein